MEEQFARLWEDLIGRLHGPLTLRLLLQPAMAILFATRAGLRDAREGREPYFWRLFKDRTHHRMQILHEEWHDVGKIFVLAVILDMIYQWLVLKWIYPGETLIVATILAFVPYLMIRGTVTRIARLGHHKPPPPRAPETSGTKP